ncbi:MAG: potassium-transporting ATPase subunit KdpC [Propionibacteriales bacterium]|nr:potassium-transporting ATPase subunit KdpC [Propionibacteriales bacterium]
MFSAVARQLLPAFRAMIVMTLLLGLAYPLVLTGFAQVAFSDKADGSLVRQDGKVVGSSLIGQSFDGLPQYFQSRPSAAGDGYDPLASGASNLGPENGDLLAAIEERRTAAAELDGTAPGQVAPDALTASGSGLDPQISPAYAEQQVARVARERGMAAAAVRRLVEEYTDGRSLGFLGEPGVNVLLLNLALDRASGKAD